MRKRQQHGMTLVEVLVALLVLSVGVVALVKFQSDVIRNQNIVNQHSEAIAIAKNKLDELRKFEVIATTTGKTAYDDIVDGTSTVSGTNASYSLSWTVVDVTDPPHKKVTVTVTWTDHHNTSRSISMESIIGKVDPNTSGTVSKNL